MIKVSETAKKKVVELMQDEDTIVALKDSGCRTVQFGMESGDEEFRKTVLKRKYNDDEIYRAIELLKKVDLPYFTYNIFGFPFETMDDIEDTFNSIKELKNNASIMISIWCPYPNTELFEYCIENKIIDDILKFY